MKFLKKFSPIKNKSINNRIISTNFIDKNCLKVFLLSTNFKDYCNKKTNRKRQLYSLIACFFGGFIVAALITVPELIALIGDPLYLSGDKVLLNLMFSLIAILNLVSRVFCYICKYLIYLLLYKNLIFKVSEIMLCSVCKLNMPFKII
jgi:hypothetical protein